jgi:hypothetical protein
MVNPPWEEDHSVLRLAALALSLSLVGLSSAASAVTLTFEGLPPLAHPANYYDGGFAVDAFDPGTIVAGPGPDYGIRFVGAGPLVPNAGFGLDDLEVIVHAASINIRMSVDGGFTGSLELDYLSNSGGNLIDVYDGPDATGNILATFTTSATVGQTYAHASIPFAGTAFSVRFRQQDSFVAYDNIQVVPEPATAALLLLGLAALGARRRAS